MMTTVTDKLNATARRMAEAKAAMSKTHVHGTDITELSTAVTILTNIQADLSRVLFAYLIRAEELAATADDFDAVDDLVKTLDQARESARSTAATLNNASWQAAALDPNAMPMPVVRALADWRRADKWAKDTGTTSARERAKDAYAAYAAACDEAGLCRTANCGKPVVSGTSCSDHEASNANT